MKRKGSLFILAIAVLLGMLSITMLTFIYWLFTFKIHIFEIIIEEYHYNRVQEIPLTIISSDYEGESFVERVNKAYYGFEIGNLKNSVRETTIQQVGEEYWWSIVIGNLYFGKIAGEDCVVSFDMSIDGRFLYCKCSEGCPLSGRIVATKDTSIPEIPPQPFYCNKPELLVICLGSLTVNVTFFNDTFPFPLVFNGSDKFITEMMFNAYV